MSTAVKSCPFCHMPKPKAASTCPHCGEVELGIGAQLFALFLIAPFALCGCAIVLAVMGSF